MASLPADEDYARAVLWIFQTKHVQPRQSLRMNEVRAAFLLKNIGRPRRFEAAVSTPRAGDGWRSPWT